MKYKLDNEFSAKTLYYTFLALIAELRKNKLVNKKLLDSYFIMVEGLIVHVVEGMSKESFDKMLEYMKLDEGTSKVRLALALMEEELE